MTKVLSELDEANIQLVIDQRIRQVSKIPRDVRAALMVAVKQGRLCHLKGDTYAPEYFCVPEALKECQELQTKVTIDRLEALAKIYK